MIRLESLELYGFGIFREGVRIDFPPGLGVLIGPNERGKSTVLQGIGAVLFGLPTLSDPTRTGTGRFRNRERPRRFEGELILEIEGVRFRIVRDFDTHRIGLYQEEAGGWSQIVSGEHNPNAKKPNPRYIEWLAGVCGHTSRALFEATFSIGQPMPTPDRLDAEVQALLTGNAGGHRPALERIARYAKELTRATGALGLTPRDGQLPGKLERIEEEIAEVKREIAEGGAAVGALRQTTEALARLQVEAEEERRRLRRAEGALAAFRGWREGARRIADRTKEVAQLRQAARQVVRLDEELATAVSERERRYGEFEGQGDRFGEGLESLASLFATAREIAAYRREAGAIEARLRTIAEEKGRLFPWLSHGETARAWVRELAGAAERVGDAWLRFSGRREELARLRAEREERYAPFEEAAPALLETIEAYPVRRETLRASLERARAELRRAEEREERAKRERHRLAERFGDVLSAAGAEEALDALRRIDAEAQALDETIAGTARALTVWKWGRSVLAAVGAALITIAAFGRGPGGGLLAVAGLIVALAALGLGWIGPVARRTHERRRALRRQEELAEERRRRCLEAGLADTLSPVEIARLAERVRAFKEAEALLDEEEGRPAGEDLEPLREAVREAEAELAALEEAVRGPREAYEDFAAAFKGWKEAARRVAELEEALAEELDAWGLGGVSPFSAEEAACGGMKGDWSLLCAGFWRLGWIGEGDQDLSGSPNARLGEIVGMAREGMRERLAELESRAEAYDRLSGEERELEGSLARLLGRPGEEGLIEAAQARVRTISARLEEAFPGPWEEIAERAASGDAAGAADLVPPPFAGPLRRADGDVDALGALWEEKLAADTHVETLRRSRDAALSAWQAESIEELESRLAAAEGLLSLALREMEELVAAHPALPRWDDQAGLEEVEARIESLAAEAESLREAIEKKEERARELAMKQAELQGARPVNLAQAELRLEALSEERSRIKREVEAVRIAFEELNRAAEAYYSSHLDRLAEQAGAYFARLSRRPGRRLAFGERLEVLPIEPGGEQAVPASLSRGAQDQLYLSLRLALADLLSGRTDLPFLFDDPFVTWDEERLEALRETLAAIAERRQVVLVSHREEFGAWGAPIRIAPAGEEGRG